MKILMFGRGVIAAAYGWALERAGHEVEFYVRPVERRSTERRSTSSCSTRGAGCEGGASPRSGRCVTAKRWSRTTTST